MTYQDFLADLFADWTDHQLAEFICSARVLADRHGVAHSLSIAADIAGKLAEAELDQRETEQRRVMAEIHAEIDARREYEALLAAQPDDLPDFTGDEAPF